MEHEIKQIPIKAMQKTSLIDYAPYTSAVIFIGGCNFRCPYCHNSDLVLRPEQIEPVDEEEVIDLLVDRKGWIDAVVITGGEPTLYPDLKRLAKRFKDLGLKVKLDTNGSNPELVWEMLEEKLLDFIAMDIKAPLDEYENMVKNPVDTENIKKSISLLMNSGISYEFRTTVAKNIIGKDTLLRLVAPLKGAKRFVLQNFRVEGGVLDDSFLRKAQSYTKEELEELKSCVEMRFDEVEVRH